MQTEETKDNGTKAEGTDFGCCGPENFQKMFEKMGKCCPGQGDATKIYGIDKEEIYSRGRRKTQVKARDLLCYWVVRELGISCTNVNVAKRLGMSQPGVGYAVSRGEKIAKKHKYQLHE